MPTYIISASPDLMNSDRKARLAAAITRIHREETGAETLFARVAFRSVEAMDCFLGGQELSTPHCFIDARIRAGRPVEVRSKLTERIVQATVEALGVPRQAVWHYLTELPPHDMVEYGRALPEPGHEAAWLDGLSEADHAFIRKTISGGAQNRDRSSRP